MEDITKPLFDAQIYFEILNIAMKNNKSLDEIVELIEEFKKEPTKKELELLSKSKNKIRNNNK